MAIKIGRENRKRNEMIIMIILIFWIAVDVVYETESKQFLRALKTILNAQFNFLFISYC